MSTKFIALLLLCSTAVAGEWTHDELRRFKAAEANQGVAAALEKEKAPVQRMLKAKKKAQ